MKIAHLSDVHWSASHFTEIKRVLTNAFDLIDEAGCTTVAITGDFAFRRGFLDAKQIEGIGWMVDRAAVYDRDVLLLGGNHDETMSGETSATSALAQAIDLPRVFYYDKPHYFVKHETSGIVGMLLLPHISKSRYAGILEVEVGDPQQAERKLVEDVKAVVQGYVAEMREAGCTKIICLYHGSVIGGKLDSERSVPAGMDLALPVDTFAGIDLGLFGHLHRSQRLQLPDGFAYYAGSPYQLNFGERANRAILRIFDTEENWPRPKEIVLEQTCYRVQMDFTQGDPISWDTDSITEAIMEADLPPETYLKCVFNLPKHVLETITDEWCDALQGVVPMYDLTVIKKPTDRKAARFDVAAKSFDDLLDHWLDHYEYDESAVEGVKLVASEIEVQADAFHDTRYRCAPLRIKVSNWKPFSEAEIVFSELDGLVCWIGQNGVGKSNLIEAELYARYGLNFKGGDLIQCIKNGEKVMEVEYDFRDIEGRTWRIRRSAAAGISKGVPIGRSKDLTLWERVDGQWMPCSGNDKRQTQALIDELVGPKEFYLSTSFAGEDDLKALVRAKKGELLDLFQKMLGFDMGGRHQGAKDLKRALELQEQNLSGKLNALEVEGDLIDWSEIHPPLRDHFEIELKALEGDPDADATQLEAAHAVVDAAKREIGKTQELITISEAKGKDLLERESDKKVEIARVEAESKKQLVDLAPIEKRIAQADQVMQTCKERIEGLEKLVKSLPVDQEAMDALKDYKAVPEMRKEWERLDGEAREADRRCAETRTKIVQQESQLIQLNADLARAKKDRELIDEVPCEGKSWRSAEEESWQEPRDMGACQFLVRAKEADPGAISKKLKEAKKELVSMKEFVDELDHDFLEAKDNSEGLFKMLQRVEKELLNEQRRDDAKAGLDSLQEQLDRLHDDRSDEVCALQEAMQLNAKTKEEQKRLSDKHDKLYEELRGLADAARLEKQVIDDLQSELSSRTEHFQRALILSSIIESRVKQRKANLEKISRVSSELHRILGRIRLVGIYMRAVSREGIPYLMLEAMVPKFEEVVNELLAPTDLGYRIVTVRDTQAGDRIDAIVQSFIDRRGEHDISESSGFQSTILGMALRWALAIVQSEMLGVSIDQFFQDEGFGTMSSENRLVAIDVMKRAAERIGGTFHFITHIDEMVSAADHIFAVVSDGRGNAKVEVNS